MENYLNEFTVEIRALTFTISAARRNAMNAEFTNCALDFKTTAGVRVVVQLSICDGSYMVKAALKALEGSEVVIVFCERKILSIESICNDGLGILRGEPIVSPWRLNNGVPTLKARLCWRHHCNSKSLTRKCAKKGTGRYETDLNGGQCPVDELDWSGLSPMHSSNKRGMLPKGSIS